MVGNCLLLALHLKYIFGNRPLLTNSTLLTPFPENVVTFLFWKMENFYRDNERRAFNAPYSKGIKWKVSESIESTLVFIISRSLTISNIGFCFFWRVFVLSVAITAERNLISSDPVQRRVQTTTILIVCLAHNYIAACVRATGGVALWQAISTYVIFYTKCALDDCIHQYVIFYFY